MRVASADLPVNVDFVTQVIEKEQPDAIALSFGGQTALNVGVALHDQGILAKHGVAVLGTSIDSIKQTEDRELFVERLSEIGEPTPVSIPTANVDEAIAAAEKIGYPVICRAAYALGGLGSGFCDNERELVELLSMSFTKSPQVLAAARDLRSLSLVS
jgi:carbamoyl-phosphate synthase large subunit